MLIFLSACALLISATLAGADGTEIPLILYTDNGCKVPSTTAANVSLNLNVCAVTPGLGSYMLNSFPCPSGVVIAYAFADTACGNQHTVFEGLSNCYYPLKGALAAVMLSCDQNTPGPPSSTTTIDVGPVATVGTPKSSSAADSGSENGHGSSPTHSTTSTPTTPSNPSSTGTGIVSPSGWKSLDLGTRIGIIVSLCVGIPPIIIALYALYQKRRRAQMSARAASPSYGGTPLQTYFHPNMRGGEGSGYLHSQTHLVPSQPHTPYA